MKLYFRNPYNYPEVFRDAGNRFASFDFGGVVRRRLDVPRFMQQKFPGADDWEAIVVAVEGTAMYDVNSWGMDEPSAVYPTWTMTQSWSRLEDYCRNPVGEDPDLIHDESIPSHFRPVAGQAHKVLLYKLPPVTTTEGRQALERIVEMMEKYPDVEFILHDSQSFRSMFLSGIHAATYDPMVRAKKRDIQFPGGTHAMLDKVKENPGFYRTWIGMLGFNLRDLETYEGRVSYALEAVKWAQLNYAKMETTYSIVHNGDTELAELPEDSDELRIARLSIAMRRTGHRGGYARSASDGILCDSCALAPRCAYFREGLVCGVPRTDSAKLAKLFGTRDANAIIDGLTKLGEIQADRLAKDLEVEEESGERTPDTDRRIRMLTDHGIKTAKLIDPNLNGKGVQVNVGVLTSGGGAAVGLANSPQELISGMVRELEARGVPREEITGEAIMGLLEATASRRGAEILEEVVDAEVIEVVDE